MLVSDDRLTYNFREILVGTLLTLFFYSLFIGNNLINSFMHSENQYPAKIHNQILNILSPFRVIRVSETKINQSVKPLSVELGLKNSSRISEIDIKFSTQIAKDITVFFNKNNSWVSVKAISANESTDLRILIDTENREITDAVKLEFSNIPTNSEQINFRIVRLLRPLR